MWRALKWRKPGAGLARMRRAAPAEPVRLSLAAAALLGRGSDGLRWFAAVARGEWLVLLCKGALVVGEAHGKRFACRQTDSPTKDSHRYSPTGGITIDIGKGREAAIAVNDSPGDPSIYKCKGM
jgi:hypothetical protein